MTALDTLELILKCVLLGNVLACTALGYGVLLELLEDNRQAPARARREQLQAATGKRRR